MNILFAASEAAPFIKTGGLADVVGSLPKALCNKGTDTRVILPLYSNIDSKWRMQMDFLFYTYVELSWRKQYCGVFTLVYEGVRYYFIDNEYYFKRDGVYGFMDDGERFGFFSRAVVSILPQLDFLPDVIHCNDWQTALIPIYLNCESSETYRKIKSVFTIHNIEYQGRFGPETVQDVFGLPEELYNSGLIRYENDVDLMKGAIYQADYISTVSPSYAQELRDPFFAHGLDTVICENSYKFSGILNGIDTSRYDPSTDTHIAHNYSPEDMGGKAVCKSALCRELGIEEAPEEPIIACISRLVGHKGFDLVKASLDEILSNGARLLILGTGEEGFESFFRDAEQRYKGRVSANIMYSEKKAMMIYSGADMVLMPSRSEPCGLTQMIAMRYGTVPIVREVGGLRDSVRCLGKDASNGFSFYEYSTEALMGAVNYALETYRNNKETWNNLMLADMTEALGWDVSAEKYIDIYYSLSR